MRFLLLACGLAANAQTVFTGVNLIDTATGKVTQKAVVTVRAGRIESIGGKVPKKGAQLVDLRGKWLIPGLISTHVHVSDVRGVKPPAYSEENVLRQLGVFARYGVTSVWSFGGEKEAAYKVRSAQPAGHARLFLSGDIIAGKTPDEARAMVDRVAATKPDIVKIRVDDNFGANPKMPPEVYRAVIEQSHKHGLKLAAHMFYLDDAKELLRSGADMLAHSVRDREIDDEFIALMKARNVPYCATLARDRSIFVYESTPDFFKDPFFLREADSEVVAQLREPARQTAMRDSRAAQLTKTALTMAQKNLKKAVDAGLLVVMGTDAGPSPSRFQGYFEHMEMQMMAESGLTPAQILRIATVDAAKGMGMAAAGSIAPGKWADFVVLNKDPMANIRNTQEIDSVWIAGNRVKKP